jgi:hypothetical protein
MIFLEHTISCVGTRMDGLAFELSALSGDNLMMEAVYHSFV